MGRGRFELQSEAEEEKNEKVFCYCFRAFAQVTRGKAGGGGLCCYFATESTRDLVCVSFEGVRFVLKNVLERKNHTWPSII